MHKKTSYYFKKLNKIFYKNLTIFTFHDVTDEPSDFVKDYNLYVDNDTFLNQVLWIKKKYKIIHPKDLLIENKIISEPTALITFDDGYAGTFNNGLKILNDHRIPSIVFLNMKPIIENDVFLPALICYLNKYSKSFNDYIECIGLSPPLTLTLNPNLMENYYKNSDENFIHDVNKYQGKIVDIESLEKWSNSEIVAYGNHFFDHWNAAALTEQELINQYVLNEIALTNYKNKLPFFAFTNGQPNTCFTKNNVEILRKLKTKNIFSSSGRVNHNSNKFLLDRISIGRKDNTIFKLEYRLLRSKLKTFLTNQLI